VSMFKKTMIYLGLGPDEEYEQYDDLLHAHGSDQTADSPGGAGTGSAMSAVPPGTANLRPIPRTQSDESPTVRPTAVPAGRQGAAQSAWEHSESHPSTFTGQAVRIVEAPTVKPHAVSPSSFNDAQSIGDRFKSGQPVIVNLQAVDRDVRRRIVDFASGLCYALAGKMDRVADQVYLLTPNDVVVSRADAREALH